MAIRRMILAVLMEDGTEYPEIRTSLVDQVRYDRERIRRRWPPMQDNQITFAAFTAYAAMTRQGKYSGDFDTFLTDVAAVDEYDDDPADTDDRPADYDPADDNEPVAPYVPDHLPQAAEPVPVDPIQPGASPG